MKHDLNKRHRAMAELHRKAAQAHRYAADAWTSASNQGQVLGAHASSQAALAETVGCPVASGEIGLSGRAQDVERAAAEEVEHGTALHSDLSREHERIAVAHDQREAFYLSAISDL